MKFTWQLCSGEQVWKKSPQYNISRSQLQIWNRPRVWIIWHTCQRVDTSQTDKSTLVSYNLRFVVKLHESYTWQRWNLQFTIIQFVITVSQIQCLCWKLNRRGQSSDKKKHPDDKKNQVDYKKKSTWWQKEEAKLDQFFSLRNDNDSEHCQMMGPKLGRLCILACQ